MSLAQRNPRNRTARPILQTKHEGLPHASSVDRQSAARGFTTARSCYGSRRGGSPRARLAYGAFPVVFCALNEYQRASVDRCNVCFSFRAGSVAGAIRENFSGGAEGVHSNIRYGNLGPSVANSNVRRSSVGAEAAGSQLSTSDLRRRGRQH